MHWGNTEVAAVPSGLVNAVQYFIPLKQRYRNEGLQASNKLQSLKGDTTNGLGGKLVDLSNCANMIPYTRSPRQPE